VSSQNKKLSLPEMALDVFQPDKNGWSRIVTKDEMIKRYPKLDHSNGWSWGRYESPLAQKYKLIRIPEKGAILAYQLQGFNQNPIIRKTVRKDIRDKIISSSCVVTGVDGNGDKGRLECDHKNGRYDDPRVNEPGNQELGDFQPLHKNVNTIKREHCKRCEQTGLRFDAKSLGFIYGWTLGGPKYLKSSYGCAGCYWHDVKDFHKKVSDSSYVYKQKGT
jgi:hypothetical protein